MLHLPPPMTTAVDPCQDEPTLGELVGDALAVVRLEGEGSWQYSLDDGRTWPGAANVGPNPTFGEKARKVEVHLIGYEGELYGRPIAVDFVARLRDTRKFAAADDLAAQLRADVEQARRAVP